LYLFIGTPSVTLEACSPTERWM